jgi:pyruvate dehydrogenase kinase 2/3/4
MDLAHLVSMGTLVTEQGLLANAAFLCKELPVRLAKRIVELESLPYGLSSTVPVLTVRQWYEDSLRELISYAVPRDAAEEAAFTERLSRIFERHRDVVPMLARGVLQIKDTLMSTTAGLGCPFLTQFLDRFYLSRIGIRILIAQHLALHDPVPGYSGIIALEMDPVEVVKIAIEDAGRLCEFTCGDVPAVNVIVGNSWALDEEDERADEAEERALQQQRHDDIAATDATGAHQDGHHNQQQQQRSHAPSAQHIETKGHHTPTPTSANAGSRAAGAGHGGDRPHLPVTAPGAVTGAGAKEGGETPAARRRRLRRSIAYVPSHLHHMLFELLKNSMRAVVESHRGARELPDVDVVIVFGEKDLGIKISDQGGGIARQDMDKIWTYLHTTAPPSVQRDLLEQSTSGQGLTAAPLAGFGYGLPLSRLFARYFGGDLQLYSIEGYGTDAYLWLNKLSDQHGSGAV